MQVIAHSVGSWNAYEFLMLARSQGLPMPKHLFLSAMASPDLPEKERPWRRNSNLDEEAFKVLQSYHMLRPLVTHACMHATRRQGPIMTSHKPCNELTAWVPSKSSHTIC